jgi:hypothetical protein
MSPGRLSAALENHSPILPSFCPGPLVTTFMTSKNYFFRRINPHPKQRQKCSFLLPGQTGSRFSFFKLANKSSLPVGKCEKMKPIWLAWLAAGKGAQKETKEATKLDAAAATKREGCQGGQIYTCTYKLVDFN